MGTKVKLTYFKSSGKFYDTAEYESQITERNWEIYAEIRGWRGMYSGLPLPGRILDSWDGYILVEPEDGVPALVDVCEKENENV